MPALSYWFGLKPPDLDHMFDAEAEHYLRALDEIEKRRK